MTALIPAVLPSYSGSIVYLHVSRHPDALYAAYSLCESEMRKCFLFGQVACLQTLFHFSFLFVDLCWLGDMVKFLFGKFSYWLFNTALDGMVRLRIGHANACETAFLNSRSYEENFEIRLCCHRTRKEWTKVFEACGKKKKTGFKVNETTEGMHIRHGNTSRYPDAPFIHVRRAPGHPDDQPWKSF